MRHVHPRSARGFSLVDVAVATIVIAVALTAMLVSVGSNTRVNEAGWRITQASFLAQEIREWTLTLPFSDPDPGDASSPPGPDGSNPQVFVDDLDDFYVTSPAGITYSPPRNGQGLPITALTGWSQTIRLTWRDPSNIAATVAAGASDIINVEVEVKFKTQSILTTSWLVTRRQGT